MNTSLFRPTGESVTGTIAHFFGSLVVLLILAECSLPRRRAYPGSRKNAHSFLSNCRF